jgi:hypothetical protein
MLVRVFLIVLAIVVLIVIIQRYNNQQQRDQAEQFQNFGSRYDTGSISSGTTGSSSSGTTADAPVVTTPVMQQVADDTARVSDIQNAGDSTSKFFDEFESSFGAAENCFPKDKLTAADLLPSEAVNTKWSQVNPRGQGSFKDANFLQAGYHIGLNTSQGSKRNGNMQLRSEPPNSKAVVSPWLNSDYEPDLLRKPLELGENSW